MNSIDNKYIVDGLSIDKTKNGYRVFTIPTQHFNINELDELTNERFENEIKRQEQYEKDSSELMGLWMDEQHDIPSDFNKIISKNFNDLT
jgi:hypothetical protein